MKTTVFSVILLALWSCSGKEVPQGATRQVPPTDEAITRTYPIDSAGPTIVPLSEAMVGRKQPVKVLSETKYPYADGLGLPRFTRLSSADGLVVGPYDALHFGRAGSIVRGMLEHSRKSDGKKERTDLNALADECLRLSFHGLRAKDKSFFASFSTNLDPALPPAEVVRQDIGRVLLNLINNAFYAIDEKAKSGLAGYSPEVKVQSRLRGDQIEISVQDNGPGIPEAIREKIFQPFFTTKPAGSGTGLGLSLSYDIIRAHEGTITCQSSGEEGSIFIIRLPAN